VTEYAGYLTTLQRRTSTGPDVFQDVAQVRDVGGPEGQADQIEVSHRDSNWRKYVGGMHDGGELTFDVVFDPDHASHDPTVTGSIWALLESGERSVYRLVFPGAAGATTTATFDAFVSNFGITSPLEDGLTADVTLKLSGPVVWAHVAAP
jgi:hypothetical protein